MKAARAFRGRDKILKFEGGYHGTNDYALMSVTPTELREFPRPSRNSAGIPAVLENEVLICPFNDLETTQAIIEKHHDELGAVITECCQRIIPPKPGFLQGLREITSHYQIPLIFDEVVTGFRWSYGGAQEYYGVTPDMATFGKAVGGGYPLSAVAGREEIMRVFNPVSKEEGTFVPGVGTLSGNPIAATAGLATLKILKGQGGVDRIWETGNKLMAELDRMLKEKEIQGTVVGEAPCFDVYFGVDEVTNYRDTLKADNAMMSPVQPRHAGVGSAQGRLQILHIQCPHRRGRGEDHQGDGLLPGPGPRLNSTFRLNRTVDRRESPRCAAGRSSDIGYPVETEDDVCLIQN